MRPERLATLDATPIVRHERLYDNGVLGVGVSEIPGHGERHSGEVALNDRSRRAVIRCHRWLPAPF